MRLKARDRGGNAFPVFSFGGELLLPGAGDGVKLRAAIIFGKSPLGADPAALFKAQQSRVESSLIHAQKIVGKLFDSACDAVAVLRAHGIERFEHH